MPVYPHYSQQRASPGRLDYESQYSTQWHQSGPSACFSHVLFRHCIQVRTSLVGYDYYPGQDVRYPGSGYSMYSSHAPGDSRKLPPLSTTPNGSRDDRWGTPYATTSMASGHHIRSPTASYPASYHSYSSSANPYGYSMGPHDATMPMSSHGHHLPGPDGRSSSPYPPHIPPAYTPPPISPTSGPEDSPTIKKKRKRADAAQLKILNETYARTAFPSTEERLQLAKTLDMSARSVQIWSVNQLLVYCWHELMHGQVSEQATVDETDSTVVIQHAPDLCPDWGSWR